jgi:hypothetical protein
VTSVLSTVDAHVRAVGGSTLAAENLRYTGAALGRFTVDAGSSLVTVVMLSVTPTVISADQYKGRLILFDADTATTGLRGQASDITANSTAASPVFTVTALTAAPSSGNTGSIV